MKSSWCQVTASARVYLETMLLTLKCSLAVVATIHGYKNCFASFFGLKISRHFHRTKKRTSCKSKRFCFFRVTGVTKRCLIEYTVNTTNGVTVQCLSRNPIVVNPFAGFSYHAMVILKQCRKVKKLITM